MSYSHDRSPVVEAAYIRLCTVAEGPEQIWPVICITDLRVV